MPRVYTREEKERRNKRHRDRRLLSPEQVRAKYREYYSPTKTRARKIKERYGITLDELHARIEIQQSLCACCGRPLDTAARFHIDHDHRTGRVRGVIHPACNMALGALGDGPDGLMRALAYVSQVTQPDVTVDEHY